MASPSKARTASNTKRSILRLRPGHAGPAAGFNADAPSEFHRYRSSESVAVRVTVGDTRFLVVALAAEFDLIDDLQLGTGERRIGVRHILALRRVDTHKHGRAVGCP